MKTIILVETNLFFSTKISSGLAHLGFFVEVENSLQGVKDKATPETSAVILDLSSPDLDVLAIVRDLKKSKETASIPIIAFAGHKDQNLLKSAESLGCDLVVTNSAITSKLGELLGKINVL